MAVFLLYELGGGRIIVMIDKEVEQLGVQSRVIKNQQICRLKGDFVGEISMSVEEDA